MSKIYSLLTKTFKGNYEPFPRLCESIDQFMPEVWHYVFFDKSDLALFARFASPQRILVDCSTGLPQMHELNVLGRRIWWLPFPRQQMTKIQFVRTLEEDAVALVEMRADIIERVQVRHRPQADFAHQK